MSETVNQGATKNEQNQGQETQEQKTFTQDELNVILNDRLKRERERYADYASLKEKADKYDKYEEESKTELQKATDKMTALQKELDTMKQNEKVREIRDKVAKETGIPVNLLTGDSEEDCKEQAAAIKEYAKPTYPNVKDAGETGSNNGATTAQQFAEWFNQQ